MNDVYDVILRDIPTRGTRSKLESCASLIVELRRRRQAYREVASVLLERRGIRVAVSTLHFFVRRQARLARKQRRSPETPQGDCDRHRRKNDRERANPGKPRAADPEVLQRIAGLKRCQVTKRTPSNPFRYDPDEPLRVLKGTDHQAD